MPPWHASTSFNLQRGRGWKISLRGRTMEMENAKKFLINISKILLHLSQLESHGVDLLQFLFDHVLTQTSFWFLSFHKLSAFPPIPTFPSGLLCLTQAICLCLTAVLLPVGWDDQAKPGYRILSCWQEERFATITHCAFLTFRTLPGTMWGPLT